MKVLIVDDEPLVRRALKRAFEKHGHQVVEAHDGKQAVEVWPLTKPDVVLLDILMPGLSGPQVLQVLKSDQKQGQIILMSAYSGEYDLPTIQGMGAHHFESKPFQDVFAVVKIAEELGKK